jgi:hypothetical protein
VPVREAPAPSTTPASPLEDVLRRVNRIRTAHGADPLYELPAHRLRSPAGVMSAPFVFWIDNFFGAHQGSTRLSSRVTGSHLQSRTFRATKRLR